MPSLKTDASSRWIFIISKIGEVPEGKIFLPDKLPFLHEETDMVLNGRAEMDELKKMLKSMSDTNEKGMEQLNLRINELAKKIEKLPEEKKDEKSETEKFILSLEEKRVKESLLAKDEEKRYREDMDAKMMQSNKEIQRLSRMISEMKSDEKTTAKSETHTSLSYEITSIHGSSSSSSSSSSNSSSSSSSSSFFSSSSSSSSSKSLSVLGEVPHLPVFTAASIDFVPHSSFSSIASPSYFPFSRSSPPSIPNSSPAPPDPPIFSQSEMAMLTTFSKEQIEKIAGTKRNKQST